MKPRRETIRAVLVDDSPRFLRTIRSLLHDEPAVRVIASAENASEALRLVEKLRPDLVLMDLVMPGLNGLQAVLLLRNKSPLTRVVIVTAHDITLELRRVARESGAHEILSKAHLAEELPLLLAKILEAA
jgi:DNA-binding NarL/FixJ family response regulator